MIPTWYHATHVGVMASLDGRVGAALKDWSFASMKAGAQAAMRRG
jgi:hypothetical protein